MENTVLATKWRPKLFSDLIGQDPVVTALVNSLDNKRLHHSYLFTGTRGVGKTTLARILSKCLNCETNGIGSNPCGICSGCKAIDSGQFVDLYEVDAASRTKVEDTRELLENVQYMPTQGRYKIYLIDEVHMLSTHSFNALLKTLEEPPEHVKFILATTDPQKIPSTILSRCLHFSLNRIPSEIIKSHLEKVLENEKINFEENAIKNISKLADGSIRDALSITEQCISHGDNKITYDNICKILCLIPLENINKVINYIVKEQAEELIIFIDTMYYQSVDFKYLLQEIISVFHQTAIFKVTKKSNDSLYENSIRKLSDKYNEEEVQILYQIGVSSLKDLEFAPDFKSGFEMAIIRMLMFTPLDLEKLQLSGSIDKKPSKKSYKENIIKKESVSYNADSVKKNLNNDTLTIEKNWAVIVKRLEIDSMTKNLANNISFDSQNNDSLSFLIKKDLMRVVTDRSRVKLQEALSSFLKKKISINISESDSDSKLQTLHEKNEEQNNIKLSEANNKMENDNFVKTIKEKFNATSIDNSTTINESIKGD